jgi:hypothetical protein
MKDKKLQVFVSSTYIDLIEERQAAVEAILSSGHIPAGMELFSAGDESQMTVIERWIDESDVYLLILGGRYGSIDKKTGKSYTHLEYEYALKQNKPLFAVVISDKALDQKVSKDGRKVIEQDNNHLLKDFRSEVCSTLVKFWEDKKDIKLAVHETLSDFSYRKGLVGWIRGDKGVDTALLAEEIARLTKENSELRSRIDTNSESLYNGLTYNQLEKLLKNEEIEPLDGSSDLIEILILRAEKLIIYVYSSTSINALDKLAKYKLVKKRYNNGGWEYTLTDDGHNFYLKALLMSNN